MKKTAVATVLASAIALIFLLGGCAGKRNGSLMVEKDGVIFNDSNLSFFQPSIRPLELARSYEIKKRADTYGRMMTNLQNGNLVTATGNKYLIGLVNNDSSKSVYIYHPEIPGMKLTAESGGGFQILEVRDIPYEIVIYNSAGGIIKKITPRSDSNFQEKVSHKKLVGNILVDLVITVSKIH